MPNSASQQLRESPLQRMLPEARKERAEAAEADRQATNYYPNPLATDYDVISEHMDGRASSCGNSPNAIPRPTSASSNRMPSRGSHATNVAWLQAIEMPMYPDDVGQLSASHAGSHNNISLNNSYPLLQRGRSEVALLAPLKRSASIRSEAPPSIASHPKDFVLDTHTASNTHHLRHLRKPSNKLSGSAQPLADLTSTTIATASSTPKVTYRQLNQSRASSPPQTNYRSTTFAGTKYQFKLFDSIARYEEQERLRQELEYAQRELKWARLKESEAERLDKEATHAAQKRRARANRLTAIDVASSEQLWHREGLETEERRVRYSAEGSERQLRQSLKKEEWRDRTDILFADKGADLVNLEVAIRSEACGHFLMDCEARFRNFILKESAVTRTQLLAQEKSQRITQLKYLHRLWAFKAKQDAELVSLSASERRSRAKVAEEEGSAFSLIDIEKIGVLAEVARVLRRANEAHVAHLRAIEEENTFRRQQLEVDDAEHRNIIRQEEGALRAIFREQHIATRATAEQTYIARAAAEAAAWDEECHRQQQPIIHSEEKVRRSIHLLELGDYNELMSRHQERWQNVLRPIESNVTQVAVRYSPSGATAAEHVGGSALAPGVEGWTTPFGAVCMYRKASSSLYPAGPCSELRIEVKGAKGVHAGDELDIPANIAPDAGLGAARAVGVALGASTSGLRDKALTKDQQWYVSGQQLVDGFGNTVCYFGSERTVGIASSQRGGSDEDTLANAMATNDLTLFWADIACSSQSTGSGYVDALRVANRVLAIVGFRCDPSCTNVDTRELSLIIRANFAASLAVPGQQADARRVSGSRRRSASPSGSAKGGSGIVMYRGQSGTEGAATSHADLHIKSFIHLQSPPLHFGMWAPKHTTSPNPSITTFNATPIYVASRCSSDEDTFTCLQRNINDGTAFVMPSPWEAADVPLTAIPSPRAATMEPLADEFPSVSSDRYIAYKATYVDAVAKGKQRVMPFTSANLADGPDFASFTLKVTLSHIAGADDNLTFVSVVGGPNIASLMVNANAGGSSPSPSPASLDLSTASMTKRGSSAGRAREGSNGSIAGASMSTSRIEDDSVMSLVTENYVLKRSEITATAVLQLAHPSQPSAVDHSMVGSGSSNPQPSTPQQGITSYSAKTLEVQGRLHPAFPVSSKEVTITGSKVPRRVVAQIIRRIGAVLDVGKFPKTRSVEVLLTFTDTAEPALPSQSAQGSPSRPTRPVSASSTNSALASISNGLFQAAPSLSATLSAELIPTTMTRLGGSANDFGNVSLTAIAPQLVPTSFGLALPQSTLAPRAFIDNHLGLPQWYHPMATVNRLQLLRGATVARTMARAKEVLASASTNQTIGDAPAPEQIPPCTITITIEQGATAEDQLLIDFAHFADLQRQQEVDAELNEIASTGVRAHRKADAPEQHPLVYSAPYPALWRVAIEGSQVKFTAKAAGAVASALSPSIRGGLSPLASHTSIQSAAPKQDGTLIPMLDPSNFSVSAVSPASPAVVSPTKADGHTSAPLAVVGSVTSTIIKQCRVQPELVIAFKGYMPSDVLTTILQSIFFTTKASLTSANATKVIRVSITPPAVRRGVASATRSFFPICIPLSVVVTGPRLKVTEGNEGALGLHTSESLRGSISGSLAGTASAIFASTTSFANPSLGKGGKAASSAISVPVVKLAKLAATGGDALEPLKLDAKVRLPSVPVEHVAVTIVDYMPQRADGMSIGGNLSVISPARSIADGGDGFAVHPHNMEPSFSSDGSMKGSRYKDKMAAGTIGAAEVAIDAVIPSRLTLAGEGWRPKQDQLSVFYGQIHRPASAAVCAFEESDLRTPESASPMVTARPSLEPPLSIELVDHQMAPLAVATHGSFDGPRVSAMVLKQGQSQAEAALAVLGSVRYEHNFVSDVALLKTLLIQLRTADGLVEEALIQIDVQPTYLPSYFTGMLERKLAQEPAEEVDDIEEEVVTDGADAITMSSLTSASPPLSLGATAAGKGKEEPQLPPASASQTIVVSDQHIPYVGTSLLNDLNIGTMRLFPSGIVTDEDTTHCGEGYFILEVVEGMRHGDRLVLMGGDGGATIEYGTSGQTPATTRPDRRRSTGAPRRRSSSGSGAMLLSHVSAQFSDSLIGPSRTKIRDTETNELLAETDWTPMLMPGDGRPWRSSSIVDIPTALPASPIVTSRGDGSGGDSTSQQASRIVLHIAKGTLLSDCSKLLRLFGFTREDPFGYVEPHTVKCLLRFNARDEIVSDTRHTFTIDIATPPLYTIPVERTVRSGPHGAGQLKPFANLKLALLSSRSIGQSLKVTTDQPLCHVSLSCPYLKAQQQAPATNPRRASVSPTNNRPAVPAPDLAIDPTNGNIVCNFALAKRLAGVNTMRPTPGVDGIVIGRLTTSDININSDSNSEAGRPTSGSPSNSRLTAFTPARNRPSSASYSSRNGTPVARTQSITQRPPSAQPTPHTSTSLAIQLEPSVPCALLRVVLSHIVVDASKCRANPTASLLWDLYVQPSARAIRKAMVPPVPEAEAFVSKVSCDVEGEAAGVAVLQPNDKFMAFDGRPVKVFEGIVMTLADGEDGESAEGVEVETLTAASTPAAAPMLGKPSPATPSPATPRRPSVLQLRESQLIDQFGGEAVHDDQLAVEYVEVLVLGARTADSLSFPPISLRHKEVPGIQITINDNEHVPVVPAMTPKMKKEKGGLTPNSATPSPSSLKVASPSGNRSRSTSVATRKPTKANEEDGLAASLVGKEAPKEQTEDAVFNASSSTASLADDGYAFDAHTATHIKVSFAQPQTLALATALLHGVTFASISRLSGPVRLLQAKVGLTNGRSVTRQAQVSLRPKALAIPTRLRVLMPVVGEPSPVLKGVFASDQKLLSTATFTFAMCSPPLTKGRSLDRLGFLVRDGLMVSPKTQTVHLAVPAAPTSAEDANALPAFVCGPALAVVTAATDRDLALAFTGASALTIATITSILECIVLLYSDDRSPGLMFDAKAAADGVVKGIGALSAPAGSSSVLAMLLRASGTDVMSNPASPGPQAASRGLSPSANEHSILKTPMHSHLGSTPEAKIMVRWECEVDRNSAFSSGKFIADETIVAITAPTKSM